MQSGAVFGFAGLGRPGEQGRRDVDGFAVTTSPWLRRPLPRRCCCRICTRSTIRTSPSNRGVERNRDDTRGRLRPARQVGRGEPDPRRRAQRTPRPPARGLPTYLGSVSAVDAPRSPETRRDHACGRTLRNTRTVRSGRPPTSSSERNRRRVRWPRSSPHEADAARSRCCSPPAGPQSQRPVLVFQPTRPRPYPSSRVHDRGCAPTCRWAFNPVGGRGRVHPEWYLHRKRLG